MMLMAGITRARTRLFGRRVKIAALDCLGRLPLLAGW